MSEARTAICLASSMLGHYAHCGFLNELGRHGIRPCRIAGASAGALAGALWAGGLRGEDLEREINSLSFRRAFFDLGVLLRLPGVLTWSYANGIFGGTRMRKRLGRLIGDRRLEAITDPSLEVAVANLSRRSGEVRREGPLVELVLASMSMPVLYRPRLVDGEWLADGGVSDAIPFSHWLDDPGVDRILVHEIDYPLERSQRMSLAEVVGCCHTIPNSELKRRRRQDAEASGKEIVFLTTRLPQPKALHGSKSARRMIESGKETARQWAKSTD
ncbi:patatin-like phospholipase family protein [Haloferula sp. A504]|uniref:patatin-like phospholipase family protein n=1 Tax=Haloferula sp. A504 TaxID=3373601 RepID=UPI0031C82C9A|nr:patatin-like phospholipase family protein [Verrucomicrobiaceae bacterium E54]